MNLIKNILNNFFIIFHIYWYSKLPSDSIWQPNVWCRHWSSDNVEKCHIWMSLDRIIFLPSAMCSFIFYIQLGYRIYVTTLALKIRIWIFGLYYMYMLCIHIERTIERRGKKGEGGEREGGRRRKRERERREKARETINHLSTHICSYHNLEKNVYFSSHFHV